MTKCRPKRRWMVGSSSFLLLLQPKLLAWVHQSLYRKPQHLEWSSCPLALEGCHPWGEMATEHMTTMSSHAQRHRQWTRKATIQVSEMDVAAVGRWRVFHRVALHWYSPSLYYYFFLPATMDEKLCGSSICWKPHPQAEEGRSERKMC